jgi:hypothetical protein
MARVTITNVSPTIEPGTNSIVAYPARDDGQPALGYAPTLIRTGESHTFPIPAGMHIVVDEAPVQTSRKE